jgi:DnaJ-class molecular chaperone
MSFNTPTLGDKLMKKAEPCARCTKCHTPYGMTNINGNCPKCGATIKSELRPNSWFECETCAATGRVEGASCTSCGGYGWRFRDPDKISI